MCKSWSTGVQIQHSDSTATSQSWDHTRFGGYYEGTTDVLSWTHRPQARKDNFLQRWREWRAVLWGMFQKCRIRLESRREIAYSRFCDRSFFVYPSLVWSSLPVGNIKNKQENCTVAVCSSLLLQPIQTLTISNQLAPPSVLRLFCGADVVWRLSMCLERGVFFGLICMNTILTFIYLCNFWNNFSSNKY
jgi:hypothetical protein